VMFLALGLLVYPSHMVPVIGSGLLIAAFLVFIARPLSTIITLSFSPMDSRDKLMISWAGLRGAVPIILATFPLLAGLPESPLIFNLVFFIVLLSVLVQGSTIPWVAKLLGVTASNKYNYHYPQEFIPTVDTNSQLIEVDVLPASSAAGQTVMNLNLPAGVLVLSVTRYGETIVPSGTSVIKAGDKVLILADKAFLDKVKTTFDETENP
jgi:cell volume regulation protein A